MASDIGADTQELRNLADFLEGSTAQILTVSANVNRMIYHLEWEGSSADAFRSERPTRINHAVELLAMYVRDQANHLRREAEQQESASAQRSFVLPEFGPVGQNWERETLWIAGAAFSWANRGMLLESGVSAGWSTLRAEWKLDTVIVESESLKDIPKDFLKATEEDGVLFHDPDIKDWWTRDRTYITNFESLGKKISKFVPEKWPKIDGLVSDTSKALEVLGKVGDVVGLAGVLFGTFQTVNDIEKGHYESATYDGLETVGGAMMLFGPPVAFVGAAIVVGALAVQYRGELEAGAKWLASENQKAVNEACTEAKSFARKVWSIL